MKMYEYKVEHISFDLKTTFNEEERERQVLEKLNSLGREGWELCAAEKKKSSHYISYKYINKKRRYLPPCKIPSFFVYSIAINSTFSTFSISPIPSINEVMSPSKLLISIVKLIYAYPLRGIP